MNQLEMTNRAFTSEHGGLTKLEYFAARAPHQIPEWFEPKLIQEPERPTPVEIVSKGSHIINEYNQKLSEWDMVYNEQKVAQWPWFWARLVLESEGEYL